MTPHVQDFYYTSETGVGRETLLSHIITEAKSLDWLGVFNNAWERWDVKLVGDLWHTLLIHTATEELGRKRRFTRARITAQPTLVNRALSFASLIWTVAALVSLQPIALASALLASAAALLQNLRSRRTCLDAAASLVSHAALRTSLTPADFTDQSKSASHEATVLDHPDPVSKLSIPQPSA